jgi:hypothetical protein
VVECDVALLGFGLEGSERRPDFVDSDIFVESSRVVERDSLKLLEGCGELVKLSQTSTSLSLDLSLDRS